MSKEAKLIDGKQVAQSKLQQEISQLKNINPGFCPHLAIIQVGNREDSTAYVSMKKRAAEEVGIQLTLKKLPETIEQSKLLSLVQQFNTDTSVHGILVQLPLPDHLDAEIVMESIDYHKDVDGFHSMNMGQLVKKQAVPFFIPCTPKGIIRLLEHYNVTLKGKRAVVVGRSNIVGIPIFHLLLTADCTPTLCHSKTGNLPEIVKTADILIAAIGQPEFIKGDWLKPGCVVVDVGINVVPDSSKKSGYRYVGDVAFEEAKKVASLITPVPGGVGPMTVAMLLENTVESAKRFIDIGPLDK